MKKNLILGILDNYTFQQVKKFVFSINRTSFKGDTCLFIGPKTSPFTIKMLKKHGIHLEYFAGLEELPAGNVTVGEFKFRQPINYFNYRHYVYYDYLLKNKDKYENVLLTDVRDVYFQDDPFSFEIGNSLYCALEGPGSMIRNCKFNGPWMLFAYGEAMLEELGDKRISCAGTTWGKVDVVLDYLVKMLREIEKTPDAKITIDQALHNYMIYKGVLKDVSFLKNEGGVILTMSYEKDYKVDNGLIRVGDNKLVKVIHQFNRYEDLNVLTDKIYLSYPAVNFLKERLYKTDLFIHKALTSLKLRKKKIAS
jgi:hypothetical protein